MTKRQILEQYDNYKVEMQKIQIKVENKRKPLENKENFEVVSTSYLNRDLAVDPNKIKEKEKEGKVKCTTCRLFTFMLFLSLLIRLFIYFIVYIIIRDDNYDNDDISFSFLSRIQNITNKKRILSKYSDIYYNCMKRQCTIINSNIINIGFRGVNNIFNINDLYLSLDGLDKNNNLIDRLYSGKLSFKINLDKIPYNISSLAILINNKHKNSLKNIIGGYVSIYEEDTQNEINHYSLNDIKDGVIFLYGIIERTKQENKWIFRRIYKSFDERNISYNKILLNETIIIKDIQ